MQTSLKQFLTFPNWSKCKNYKSFRNKRPQVYSFKLFTATIDVLDANTKIVFFLHTKISLLKGGAVLAININIRLGERPDINCHCI
jgi:hypothetical protein